MTRERERDREGERDIDERIKKQARVPYICQPNQQIVIERSRACLRRVSSRS